jgi:hypothetical protein
VRERERERERERNVKGLNAFCGAELAKLMKIKFV